MPRLHAMFSIGRSPAPGRRRLGRDRHPPAVQVFVMAVLAPVSMAWAVLPRFPPPRTAEPGEEQSARAGALAAWREPRTLLVGLLVLGFAFTEGSANDWMAVVMVDGYGTSETVGASDSASSSRR